MVLKRAPMRARAAYWQIGWCVASVVIDAEGASACSGFEGLDEILKRLTIGFVQRH